MNKTKFAIIGDPISHSLSPTMHNYWFKKYNIDANYSIIQVRENEIPKIIDKIRKRELTGINITLPYKQKIVSHIDLLIKDAEVTGSVNTLYRDDKEKISPINPKGHPQCAFSPSDVLKIP